MVKSCVNWPASSDLADAFGPDRGTKVFPEDCAWWNRMVESRAFCRAVDRGQFSTPVEKPVEIGSIPGTAVQTVAKSRVPATASARFLRRLGEFSRFSGSGMTSRRLPTRDRFGQPGSASFGYGRHCLGRGTRADRDKSQPPQLLHMVPA